MSQKFQGQRIPNFCLKPIFGTVLVMPENCQKWTILAILVKITWEKFFFNNKQYQNFFSLKIYLINIYTFVFLGGKPCQMTIVTCHGVMGYL